MSAWPDPGGSTLVSPESVPSGRWEVPSNSALPGGSAGGGLRSSCGCLPGIRLAGPPPSSLPLLQGYSFELWDPIEQLTLVRASGSQCDRHGALQPPPEQGHILANTGPGPTGTAQMPRRGLPLRAEVPPLDTGQDSGPRLAAGARTAGAPTSLLTPGPGRSIAGGVTHGPGHTSPAQVPLSPPASQPGHCHQEVTTDTRPCHHQGGSEGFSTRPRVAGTTQAPTYLPGL